MDSLEPEIAEWRSFVTRAAAVHDRDVDELEAHLRDQIADLDAAGLAPDEAFLVAVKRMGGVDELSREFAREHSGRLWRQLVLAGDDAGPPPRSWVSALALAVVAAVVAQAARLLAGFPDDAAPWLARDAALLVLPFLAAWFAERRGLTRRQLACAAAPFAVAAVVVNVGPWARGGSTGVLVATHLPVVLWCALAYPYSGAEPRSPERRMDLVRFTGEWCIYFALLGLGGGVLTGLAALILAPAGSGVSEGVVAWMLPSGAAGAVLVAAWLVESKQQVVENMAPVLTAVFTPLFAAMLTGAAVVYAATGFGDGFDRDLLGVFDALLVVVLGLVLYGMSARDTTRPAGWMDRTQLVAMAAALVLDAMVLASLAARIGDLGLTANRVAALGLNLVLLVDLAGSAWLAGRHLAGRGTLHRLERWQLAYLPVLAGWAALVVLVVAPAFPAS